MPAMYKAPWLVRNFVQAHRPAVLYVIYAYLNFHHLSVVCIGL